MTWNEAVKINMKNISRLHVSKFTQNMIKTVKVISQN